MNSHRANLDETPGHTTYAVLAVILLTISLGGAYFLFKLYFPATPASSLPLPVISPVPTLEPSPTAVESTFSATPSLKPTSTLKPTLTPKSTATIKPTSTPVPTMSPDSSPTPSPATQTFTSSTDNFAVIYSSSRRLYQDTETSGRRYTFYSVAGNIAVHAGSAWSWTYPDRVFSTSVTISSHPTFIYEISTQTIVDFQVGDKYYTIQCVHNGSETLKAECTQFISDFKLL